MHDGSMLKLDASSEFLDKVIKQMDLDRHSDVTDEHIKLFVFGSLNSALKKMDVDKQ